MGIFSFGKNKKDQVSSLPVVEDMVSLSELNSVSKILDDLDAKATDLQHIMGLQQSDESGYFRPEFQFNVTAGKMKALYSREPWVFICACIIARTMASIPLKVRNKKTKEDNTKHELNSILYRGSMMADQYAWKFSSYVDLILGGNGFLVFSYDKKVPNQTPVELISLVGSQANDMMAYFDKPIDAIMVSGGFGNVSGSTNIPWENVIHYKIPNPSNPFFGLSLFTAASRPILLDRHKNEYEVAFYLRGGTNSGVIETSEDVTKKRMERLMASYENAYTGRRNWWRMLFLPKGAKFVPTSLTMNEMQHLEGLRENRLTLLAVLGVPPSKVGIVQDVNRSTSEVQEKTFYENTIMPLMGIVEAGWNNSLLVKEYYRDEVEVYADYSNIESLNGSIQSRGEQAMAVRESWTINEIRTKIWKIPPLKESDPRGNQFPTEVRPKIDNPFLFGGEQVDDMDLGPEETGEKKILMGDSGPSTGKDEHSHTYEIDDRSGNGRTISTRGSGPKHDHEIVDGVFSVAGDDNHTHPTITFSQSRDDELIQIKRQVSESQERAEKKNSSIYLGTLNTYLNDIVKAAKEAILDKADVRQRLINTQAEREETYLTKAIPVLWEAMEDGFNLATRQFKALDKWQVKYLLKQKEVTDQDRQALEAIRQRTREQYRKLLMDRALKSFKSFDSVETEIIMQILEDGMREGLTQFDMVNLIEERFKNRLENHKFTIVRTEVLSAISEGLNWNNQALTQIYSKVMKRWFHVGDGGSNESARQGHIMLDAQDPIDANDEWINPETNARLRYPRDPSADASETINCRCSISSIIPNDAVSNSDMILNT